MNASTPSGKPDFQALAPIEDGLRALNSDELFCLVVGGRTLASHVYEYVSERSIPPADTFRLPESDSHTCYQRFQVAWEKIMAALEKGFGCSQPFSTLHDALVDCELCDLCRTEAQAHIKDVELDIWRKLPNFFDLVR